MDPARKGLVPFDAHSDDGASQQRYNPDSIPGTPNTNVSANASVAANDGVAGTSLRPVTFTPTLYTRLLKPALDLLVALLALAVFAIPMLIIASVVFVSMGNPVLFRQRRVGLNGKVFYVLKFRTMGRDRRSSQSTVDENLRLTHKSDKDPRHTAVGMFLRKFSLDELPQLVNIVRGEMSIVGPRPELEDVVNTQYPEYLDRRHLVKPGLTGLWQISARGEGPMHENGEWDLEYVETISPLTDIKLLCKTPFAMFGRNQGH